MRFQRPAMKTHVLGQRRKSEEWCTRTITKSALKNHNLAHSKHSEGSCTRTSTSSTLKTHDLAHIRQSEGRCTRTSTTSKKPLKRGECNCNCNCKEMTHASDVKAEKGSAIHVRVPITNITKAKPCFMITWLNQGSHVNLHFLNDMMYAKEYPTPFMALFGNQSLEVNC